MIPSNDFKRLLRSTAVLVLDDEEGMRNFLRHALQDSCALLEVADCVQTADELRKRVHFDLMIVDIRLPDISGVEWLKQLREEGVATDMIFITAYADLDIAIQALRAGASDFLLKPFRMEQILGSVQRCLERSTMARENLLLRRELEQLKPMDGIVGSSEPVQQMCQLIKRVAPTAATILVEGETGSGKELVARAIYELSGRSGAFVALNCGSVSPELIESELFGHTKGAFTGASGARQGLFQYAQDGVLFLDEIGEMSQEMQAKLLRVLEEKRVRPVGAEREIPANARVITATNRKLADLVAEGRFREDLFYRLEVVTIPVPPLRDRLNDLPALVNHFIRTMAVEMKVEPAKLTHREISLLQRHSWPGNVRELRNVIERYLLLGQFPSDLSALSSAQPDDAHSGFPLHWPLAEVEKMHILSVLDGANGNKSEAARRLGLSRKTLERKVSKWQDEEETALRRRAGT